MNLAHSINQTKQQRAFQKVVNWFVFFMVFPCINIFENSITFYFFLYLLVQMGMFWRVSFFAKNILFTLIAVVVLASVFAPYSDMPRYKGSTHTIQLVIQYVYWILTTSFFIIYRKHLNMIELSKWILIGLICFAIGFYFVDLKFDFKVGSFATKSSRNSFVFNMLLSVPLAFYYIKSRFGLKRVPHFMIGFIMVLLFTNGRSAGVIILVEALIISAILFPSWLKALKRLLIPLIIMFFALQSDSVQPILNGVASAIQSINPRFADLLEGTSKEGNLKMDKSWLERKLQVDKGLEIIGDRPLLGVGPGNFSSYDARLEKLYTYDRLTYGNADYFNTRSAHNSYILFMGEFGLLGFGLLVSLLGICLITLFNRILSSEINEQHLPLVSLLGMAMHFYAIVAITGAIAWFVLGLALSVSVYSFKK